MLSKLIRYEWKAVARVCIPMYGGLILAAMLTHFLLGNLERFSSTLYDIITMAMSTCLLYTSDAADDSLRVDLGGRRIIKKIFFQAEDGIRDER